MTTVNVRLFDVSGDPLENATVRVSLSTGNAWNDNGRIVREIVQVTNSEGVCALLLPANSTLTPDGTTYRAQITHGLRTLDTITFIVPDGAGPFELRDLSVSGPGSVTANALAEHATASNPHPQYTTAADVLTAAEDASGDAVTAHELAANPHAQYQLASGSNALIGMDENVADVTFTNSAPPAGLSNLGLSFTITLPTERTVRVRLWSRGALYSFASGTLIFGVANSSSEIADGVVRITGAGTTHDTFAVERVIDLPAGGHTISAFAYVALGAGGTGTLRASPTSPAQLTAETVM